MNILNLARILRQNHALEHATIHVLSRQHPYAQLMGRSTISGFYIYGHLSTQQVAAAVSEALIRLQQGEAYLAVHPRCGTNLAVTGILTGAAAFGATLGKPRSKLERLPLILTTSTLAAIVAQPLAQKIQEQITTTPEVDDVQISTIRRQERGNITVHYVLLGRG